MAFISSRINELKEDRDEIAKTISTFSKSTSIPMTSWQYETSVLSSKPGYDLMAQCLKRIQYCNYCVFLLSNGRYGNNPPKGGYNPHNLSATELEYDKAVKNKNITRIVFEKGRKRASKSEKYENFRNKIKANYDHIIPYNETHELSTLFLSAIVDKFRYGLYLQQDTIDIYSEQMRTLFRTIQDIIDGIDWKKLKSTEMNIAKRRIRELKRAWELDIYSKNKKGAKLSEIRYLRREGRLRSAIKLANELIEDIWPECKSDDVSTMYRIKNVDLNLLCYVILEKGLILRYNLDLKRSLHYLEICYRMCKDTHIKIPLRIKQRVIDVIAGAYFYLGNISKAEELVKRADTILKKLKKDGEDFEPGAESELALFKAELKAVNKDKDAIIKLDRVRRIKENEGDLLSIVVCDIDKAMYYNFIGKRPEAKMIIDNIKKSNLYFIFEMDTFVKELWKLAKKGSTFDGMFKRFNRDTSIPD